MSASQLPGAVAPLPSPTSVHDKTQYFSSLDSPSNRPPQGQPETAQGPSAEATTDGQQPKRQESSSSIDSVGSNYLKDSTLLAEAAKRAQMAVVARDLGDVQL